MRLLRLSLVVVLCLGAACSFETRPASEAPSATGADEDGRDDPPPTADGDERASTRDADDEGAMLDEVTGYEESIELAVADVEDFWESELVSVYGIEYDPIDPDDIVPGEPGADIPDCGGFEVTYAEVEQNAFYCPDADYITYDDADLFPELFDEYGTAGMAVVLAHEWGHRAQSEASLFDDLATPTLTFELQADCFAGAWVARVHLGESDTFELLPGALEAALGSLLEFRDPVGSSPDDPLAHGSGFDRASAFQDGFEAGVRLCSTYVADPPPTTLLDFLDAEDLANEGNLDLPDAIQLARESLNLYWGGLGIGFLPIEDLEPFDVDDANLPECGRRLDEPDELEGRVFYCPDDRFVAWDEDVLDDAHDDGDFSVVTLLALEWSRAVLDAEGADLDSDDAALVADCLTGSYAGALLREEVFTVDPVTGEENGYFLSPGDLDEAMTTLLVPAESDREIDDDPDRAFVRIQAFRTGFFDGAGACEAAVARFS